VLAYLTLTVGQKPGRSFVLQPGAENRVGRGAECQVVLADPECSRVHAVLQERDGRWEVRDQSLNGTFLNGQAIREAFLAEGSILRLGSTELAFHLGEESPTLAAPLEGGLTQTIVRDTPVTEHDSSELAVAIGDSPELQDLWRLHQFSVRLLTRRQRDEIVRDAMHVLQERTEASAVAYFALDRHQQLRLKLAPPEGALLGPLPGEALTQLIITQGRALWVANQHARQHQADVLYLPLLCEQQVAGALYVYLEQGHFRQSQFDFAISVANLASRALGHAMEDNRRECDLARAAEHLGIGQALIGTSPAIRGLRERLNKTAPSGRHILLRGERGAGKKLAARWLHENAAQLASQIAGPFVVFPCAGATEPEAASAQWLKSEGGTLYLEEIGKLPPTVQQVLMQYLAPSGASRQSDAASEVAAQRIIAGTSIDLRALARRGEFAQELLDVLTEHEVEVPPLRERREDLPALIDHFLAIHALRAGRPELRLSEAARQRLIEQEWPGNAAQLEHVLQLALLTATGPVIEQSDLALGPGRDQAWESLQIDHWERRLITLALQRAGGNVPEAAKLLGIGRATLYRKLEEYGIQR
jgi:Nif-specific regulatory protein